MPDTFLHILVIILGGLTALQAITFIYLVHKKRIRKLVLAAPMMTGVLFLVLLFMLLDAPKAPPV